MSQDVFPSVQELPETANLNDEAGTYHLRIKVATAEFDANGPVDVVREDYDRFLDLISKVGMRAIEQQADDSGSQKPDTDFKRLEDRSIESNTWDKVFLRNEGRLSLNMLPETKHSNGDALLMIVYGYQKLMEQPNVTSVTIMESAKQSGLRIDRIDRSLSADQSRLLLKGGSGKGSRYSLHNRGLAYVEELLTCMFD